MLLMGKSAISTGPFSSSQTVSLPEAKSHLEITRFLLVFYPMKHHHEKQPLSEGKPPFSYGFPMVFPLNHH
jgi:hypothetical protein